MRPATVEFSKVPEVTIVFWIIKIAATTLGETGGDTITITLNWGYLAGTALFLGLLLALVVAHRCSGQPSSSRARSVRPLVISWTSPSVTVDWHSAVRWLPR